VFPMIGRTEPEPPLRVAMVSTPWFPLPPTGYGGIEAMCADLVDGLVERGHDVRVLSVGANGTSGRQVPVAPDPQPDRVGQTNPEVLHAARVARLLAGMDVDVVHDHSSAGPLQAALRPWPTVVTAHGPVSGEIGAYYREIDDSVHLVAISGAQQAQASDLRWHGRVHNALRISAFPLARGRRAGVAFLGRIAADKGAHLAIDAARAAGESIVLAGPCMTSRDRDYFEAQVRPRLGEDARWVGELGFAAKVELLAGARCLLFPVQWEEPFGMVMVEAMACGTPVVALRRGSVPEVVEHGVTGYVLDDPQQLAAAVRAVERLRPQDCRSRARRLFDVGVMAAGYEDAYRRALRSRRPRLRVRQQRRGRPRVGTPAQPLPTSSLPATPLPTASTGSPPSVLIAPAQVATRAPQEAEPSQL
jgi:glycosyltransferase involved in cell wall biosynthesis